MALSHWDEEGIPGRVARLCLCPQWTLFVVLCGLCLVHCGLWYTVGSVCGALFSVLLAKSSSDPHVPSPSCIWSLYGHMEGPTGSKWALWPVYWGFSAGSLAPTFLGFQVPCNRGSGRGENQCPLQAVME